jgi:hypothetical protein
MQRYDSLPHVSDSRGLFAILYKQDIEFSFFLRNIGGEAILRDHSSKECINVVGGKKNSARGHFRHAGLNIEEL